MEHIRSVAMGVWIRAGSRHELPEVNGISHFVEHMVFKGTRSRSAKSIAREVDAIGGNLDAFTGKETICFNLKVLDQHVPTALDILSDLVLNPVFNNDDIMREQGVILEEIKMDEDNPDYLVHEIFTQSFWRDHPLGKPILGTKETVRRFQQDILFDYYGKRFSGKNMVFSAAGNLEHDAFVDLVARRFDHMAPYTDDLAETVPQTASKIVLRNKKGIGAGAAMPGRSFAADCARSSLCNPAAEYGPGRRYELATVPDGARRAWTCLLHFQRSKPLPGYRLALRLRGHLIGALSAGDRVDHV